MGLPQAPFHLVAAFTTSPFGGNPAAVVILDVANSPPDLMSGIAKNLNQPMAAFISPESTPSPDPQTLKYLVRFFASNGKEVPICGHATLASSNVVFSLPAAQAANVHTIEFKAGEMSNGATLVATKVDDGFIQINIPSTVPGDVSDEDKARLKTHIDKAFGRDVKIIDIKTGGVVYDHYVMFELDEAEDLAGSAIDASHLLGTGFFVHVLTASSPDPKAEFVSRMFSPLMIASPFEDAVCGSAHGTLSPYWYTKKGIPSGQEVRAKQVSERGGDLRVVWEKDEGRVKLRGQCTMLASGQLQL